ncbi:MAG: diacylglycerol kinase family protein [Lysobacteraceae bacterium]
MEESTSGRCPAAIPVIVNCRSGCGHDDAWSRELAALFASENMSVRIVLASDGAALQDAIRDALAGDPELVVAGGGDGTINRIAGHLVGKNIPLGILPLGTLNHFAKDLHIPLDLAGAVHTLAGRNFRKVDIGDVNGRIFLNNSSIGMYPLMVQDRDRQQRSGLGKWPALLKASWKIMSAHRSERMRLVVDGRPIACTTPLVFIGNNRYVLSGFDIGARQSLDAGELSLYIVPRDRRWSLLWLGIRALFGHTRQDSDFQALTAGHIEIDAPKRRMDVATDGEVEKFPMPLRYRIHKQALRVIAPAITS